MHSNSIMKAIVPLIICTFLWGSCYPIGKTALEEMSAFTLVFWRFVIASTCLILYLCAVRTPIPRLRLDQWIWVVAISASGIAGFNLIVFVGLSYTSPTNGSLIMALSPIVTSVIASVAIRKLPSKIQCVSLVISLVGVLMVITNGHIETLRSFRFNWGDQLILCGMFSWSIYTYFSQSISRWMLPSVYTFVGMFSGTVVTGMVCFALPSVHPIYELKLASMFSMLEVGYIGLFGTVLGYLLWLSGIQRLGSANASVFFNLVPIFSVVTSLALGQPVTGIKLLGIGVVLSGLLLPRLISFTQRRGVNTESV